MVQDNGLGQELLVVGNDDIDLSEVRRIFAFYADGRSARWIANTLNREGVPSPGSTWARTRKARGWTASAIAGPSDGTGILNNEAYVGRIVWNRRQWVKDPATGKRLPRPRPESEWIVTEQPELRIVDQPTWDRVKRRQREVSLTIGARVRAGLAPSSANRLGRPPQYLFSGMLRCGYCGANFIVTGTTQRYRCASRVNGRQHLCSNRLGVPRAIVEARLLEDVKASLLAPDVIADVVRRVREGVAEAQRAPAPDAKRIATLEAEIARLVDAVASGVLAPSPAVRERQERAEGELARLRAATAAPVDKVERMLPKVVETYRAMIANLEEVARRDVAKARASLRALLGDAIVLRASDSGDYLEAVVADGREGLLALAANSLNFKEKYLLVAGEGFEPSTFGL